MSEEHLVMALLAEGNPATEVAQGASTGVPAATYLATLEQRSSEMTKTDQPVTTKSTGPRRGLAWAAAFAIILTVAGLYFAFSRDDGQLADRTELFVEIAPGEMVELPGAPISGGVDPAGVWTDTEWIVWGGDGLGEGAAFNAAKGTWRLIAQAPIAGRREPNAVWTGTEMIVWGGYVDDDVRALDGAAYDPASDTWRLLPPAPGGIGVGISLFGMVWTGDEAVLLGDGTAAAYDPTANSWRWIAHQPGSGYEAVWTGDAIVLVDSDSDRMMRYDLAADRWSGIEIGSSAALVGIPGSDGLLSTFVNLPSETGAPTQVLDSTSNLIAELPAFPGDPSLFGDHIGASGLWVGHEAIFWIWTGKFPYENEQWWALNPSTQTWRQLDAPLPGNLVVAGDVLFGWEGDGMGVVAYRAGTTPAG